MTENGQADDKAKTSAKKKVTEAAVAVEDAVETSIEEAEADVAAAEDRFDAAFDSFIDHQKKAAEEAGKAIESMIPQAVREHGSAAIKEMIEGYRGLFNSIMDEVNSKVDDVKQRISRKEKETE